MDIAWKEDRLMGGQRSWRVVFSDGVMRIRGSRYDRGSGRWVGEVDAAIRPEDVLSVEFEFARSIIHDVGPDFPDDYTLEMKYRNPRDGSKAKVEWPLRYPDEETLGALLGGLEGFVESSKQRNISYYQMHKLRNYSSRAEESARQAAGERRKDESFEVRQGDISNMVKRDRLDKLGRDKQKLSALLRGTSFYIWITLGILVLGICLSFVLCAALQTTGDMFWLGLTCLFATVLSVFVVGFLLSKWLEKRSWRVRGQHVILNRDGIMLLANDREGEEVRCWYTEGYNVPLRITRIDGYEAKRRRIVLRGSFFEGRIDPASGRSFVSAGDGNRVDKLSIYRIYSDEDERRLLNKLDTLVVRSTVAEDSSADQPW